MPYRRKRSSAWWVSYTDTSGTRVRRSTGTTDRKEAAALEAKWKLEAYRTRQWEEKPARTFDELMLAYLKATQNDKRDPQRDRDAARHLRGHFHGRDLMTLKAIDTRDYIAARRMVVKAATVNRELCLLSSAINYARREWEWDIPNPVSGRKLKEPEGRVRWISRAEAVALLASATREGQAGHLPDFIRLALHTGCRKNELLKLEWRRVDLHAGLFHLEARHTKTARRRSVPRNAEARAALMNRARFRATYCPDSPWVFTHEDGSRLLDVKKSFRTACRRAGIADFRIHDLRHTCAAWLVSAGVPLMSVRDLLGHASIKMTERYAHLAPDNVRLAVRQLEGEDEKSHFGHTG